MLMSSSSMTALRGPWWLRPRLLATSKSCTRLSRATIHKRPARACAAPEVDRSQHASSIPPKAMASPVSELIHNTAVLAVPTTYPKAVCCPLPLRYRSSGPRPSTYPALLL
jgi:hypothetical protein